MAEKLIARPIATALGIAPPARGQTCAPNFSAPVPVRDEAVLDSLTRMKRGFGIFKTTILEMSLVEATNVGAKIFRDSSPWGITIAVQPPGTEGVRWDVEEEQNYVVSVLMGLVKPHFIVNHIRDEGRLLTGMYRLKALHKWMMNELPVVIRRKALIKQQLLDADQNFFSRIPVTFTVYDNLTVTDELTIIGLSQSPAWQ